MGPLTGATQQLITQLQSLAVPFGIIGLLCAVLAFFLTPLLGDALGNHKGYIQRALLGIAFIGFIPGIVATLYALGSSGGAGG